jgi:hypothetical protein
MNPKRTVRWLLYATSVVLFLASLFCFLWIFSSYSMAFTECSETYGLFAIKPRCRQPAIASILSAVFLALSIVLPILGHRRLR